MGETNNPITEHQMQQTTEGEMRNCRIFTKPKALAIEVLTVLAPENEFVE